MDIYSALHEDHLKMNALLEHILSTTSDLLRSRLFKEAKQELLLHTEAENTLFYEALREHKDLHEEIARAQEEHQEIRKYLRKLNKLPIDTEKWLEQFGEFKHSVMHHVKNEGILFKKAKKLLTDAQASDLAVKMEEMKRKKLNPAA